MKNLLLAVALLPLSTQAAVVALTPAQINGGDTTRTSFTTTAGDLTITPTIVGTTDATFNDNADRLGIDDNSTNPESFNDPDIIVGNAGDEGFTLAFGSNAGLTNLSWDFSRGAVVITGFLSDPMATISGPAADVSFDSVTGSLSIDVVFFSSTPNVLNLDPTASVGQTLSVSINDTNEAGAQLAVTSISFEDEVVAIPEPSSALLLGLFGLVGLVRRRR